MYDPQPQPLYRQIADTLLREIAVGRLLEGERLVPEREMAAQQGVSVGTLRKALADLTARGHLERRQGSGNYVRHTRDPGAMYGFFRLERVRGGGLPTAEGIEVRRMAKPVGAPDFGPSETGIRIRRIRSLGGIACVAEEIWLDGAWGDGIGMHDISGSLYRLYDARLGLRIARVEDRVGVGAMPDWGAAKIAVADGAPCGFVERDAWDRDGARVEFSQSWFDYDRARYVSRMK